MLGAMHSLKKRAGALPQPKDGFPPTPPPCNSTVVHSDSTRLRLYTEQPPPQQPELVGIASLPAVLRAFQRATGWMLHYTPGLPAAEDTGHWTAPVAASGLTLQGHFSLTSEEGEGATAPTSAKAAQSLAVALADMVGELLQTRQALWHREAELAAGVPLVPHSEEEKHLATRLQSVLEAGARSAGCQAVGLYLLDEATTELKLRAAWGLPFDRFTQKARPLRGALADLEALLGHAVVLDDTDDPRYWRIPEDFPSAVCLPISSPTTILGTVWFFADRARGFSDAQTSILEIVAGRIAADLEREMLLREGVDAVRVKRQHESVARMLEDHVPTTAPELEGWEVGGSLNPGSGPRGDFYDWFVRPDGRLVVGVGQAAGGGISAALVASEVRTALRSHAFYHAHPRDILNEVNRTIRAASPGDAQVGLACMVIDPETGLTETAVAGDVGLMLIRSGRRRTLSRFSPPIGESDTPDFHAARLDLREGDELALWGPSPEGWAGPQDLAGLISRVLRTHAGQAVRDQLEQVAAAWSCPASSEQGGPGALVVVRRRP